MAQSAGRRKVELSGFVSNENLFQRSGARQDVAERHPIVVGANLDIEAAPERAVLHVVSEERREVASIVGSGFRRNEPRILAQVRLLISNIQTHPGCRDKKFPAKEYLIANARPQRALRLSYEDTEFKLTVRRFDAPFVLRLQRPGRKKQGNE